MCPSLSKAALDPVEIAVHVAPVQPSKAAPLDTARSLTADTRLVATGTRTALLDVAVEQNRGMPFVVSDLGSRRLERSPA